MDPWFFKMELNMMEDVKTVDYKGEEKSQQKKAKYYKEFSKIIISMLIKISI